MVYMELLKINNKMNNSNKGNNNNNQNTQPQILRDLFIQKYKDKLKIIYSMTQGLVTYFRWYWVSWFVSGNCDSSSFNVTWKIIYIKMILNSF